MNRDSRVGKELFAYTSRWLREIKPIVRWRILIAALLLALAIGSVGQASIAQAAPAPELVNFSMKVENPKTILRCGETVTYILKVELQQVSLLAPTPAPEPLGSPKGLPVINIKVEALSRDQTVGDFVGAKNGIATARTEVVFDDDLATLGAKFKFKAKKVGKTTLYFDGLVEGQYVSFNLPVKVIPCKYKVKTTAKFSSNPNNDPAILPPPITARMENAELTADANGHFTGTANMQWFGGTQVSLLQGGLTCTVVEKFSASSPVDLTGEMSDDGQFTLNLTYDTVWSSFTETCSVASASGTLPYILDPMKLIMPDTGGSLSQPQGYNKSSFMGSVAIEVTPEEDTATAFNPSVLAASPGSLSPWAAMLGNIFPRWGGALALALHP